MRASIFFAAAIATVASAAAVAPRSGGHDFPGCAVPCLIESDRGHCDNHPTLTCLCDDSSFNDDIHRCIDNACNSDDQNDALDYIHNICH